VSSVTSESASPDSGETLRAPRTPEQSGVKPPDKLVSVSMATEQEQELEHYQGAATIEKVAALCRRRAFVFPSSDIYGGLGSSYDYGHYGVLPSRT
jgi:hypothetical protein